jgi:hypothetical protein
MLCGTYIYMQIMIFLVFFHYVQQTTGLDDERSLLRPRTKTHVVALSVGPGFYFSCAILSVN